jgi:transcriptional regulator with XRE-family HTH domain
VTLGKAIKLVRTANGIKQGVLARDLKVSANYLSLIENGKREPSISFLRRMATALRVPVGIFFLWQDIGPVKTSDPVTRQLRELLTRLEAMYLLSGKPKQHSKRKAA